MPPDPARRALKAKARAILDRTELDRPDIDHGHPRPDHADQRARGKSAAELARLPIPEPPE